MVIKRQKRYYFVGDVAEHLKLSIHDLIHYGVLGTLQIATYVNTDGLELLPYPSDATDTHIYRSGLYYIDKREIINFEFNHGKDFAIIKYITPVHISMKDYDLSPEYPLIPLFNNIQPHHIDYLEDELIASVLDDNYQYDNDLLCFTIIGEYVVNIKDLVIIHNDLIQFLVKEYPNIEEFDFSDNSSPRKENQKSINSLLKMVIAMAYEQYGYDPETKKSDVPQRIVDDADVLGLEIDADTVRNWLKKGVQLVDQNKIHSKLRQVK